MFLNSLGNFELSLLIPGFDQTNFISFRTPMDVDHQVCESIKYGDKRLSSADTDLNSDTLLDQTSFRFLKQRKQLF